MMTIDLTHAVLRDGQGRDDPHWTKPYVDWLVEYVGMQVHFDPSKDMVMDQGQGWRFYQSLTFIPQGASIQILVDIDDDRLGSLFALRWL